ncbi:E3 ubiquitin-protein ligase KCMF1 isoform X2 [Bemisia tabaci]|uniref:E3 ubiquitin-protein ligase KCMF1 isoform X2 n=1 Tax=Bemisia tabaci TaxID=7038 RepID=UPI0008F9C5EE|nr:PREDICTED: E3 ubiquitin-protein ligase KCMF1-like isoform X2 [Bemisia tabaci]
MTSRHEGVSCDSCLKGNFRGRRFKCLICFDYDLCANCYEGGATSTRHTTEHPVQCILTRADFELYYGGESLALDQPQVFTCPFCGSMGHTDSGLQEHVAAEHSDLSYEVICPICASLPGGEANLTTDDFAGHLTLEHRSGPRDLISFLDDPMNTRHSLRRITHSNRGVGPSNRARRTNMHFSRESVDPIAELLSQLSGVRRNAGSTGSNSSQLQQLQMQLQLERQQVRAARQQLERLPRRQNQNAIPSNGTSNNGLSSVGNAQQSDVSAQTQQSQNQSQYLLTRCLDEAESGIDVSERADRSLFVQEMLLVALGLDNQSGEKEKPSSVAAALSQPLTFPSKPSAPETQTVPKRQTQRNGSSGSSGSTNVVAVSRPQQLPVTTAAPQVNRLHPRFFNREVGLGAIPSNTALRKPMRSGPVDSRNQNQSSEPPPSH